MMLRHAAPEVLEGPDLPEDLALDIDRVVVLDHLCCTAVAMSHGHVHSMAVASSRARALRRLSRRAGAERPTLQPRSL
jgi:hypothetical protein